MALLIRQGYIYANDCADTVIDPGDVLIDGARIVAVGPDLREAASAYPDLETIDARNRIVMPGFVDAHMHSNEGFEMGRYDNLPLEIWLSEVYPPFGGATLSARDQYLRAALVGVVSIKSGVTALQDDVINLAFTPDAVDATASALDALPLPGRAAQIALFRELTARWHGRDGIRIILGPCGPQRCSRGLLEEVAQISADLDLPIHCHVLETKTQAVTGQRKYNQTLVGYLRDAGVLTHRLTMNHAIWLTDADIDMMGEARCSISHNPLSNLKLGSGVSPVRKLLRAGVNVALGCDGVASADTADMFAAFKAAALLHKIGTHDYREWISAHEVMHMATHAGARSGLMADALGALEPGRQADVILLDRHHWGFLPLHDPVQQIAFSAGCEAVQTSIIAGRVVMRDRRLTLIDEDALRGEIAAAAERFRRDACPRMSEGAAIVRPWLDRMYERATGLDVALGHQPHRLPPGAA